MSSPYLPSPLTNVTCLLLAMSAAATTVAQSRPMLEEIIVTAQKKEESLQRTPISVAVLDQNFIENQGVSNLLDVAHAVPNLDIRQTTNGSAGARIYVRGVGVNDHVVTLDGAVGIYMDGVYIARNTGLAFDVTDLERIEVLRGPQGSLWGRNTTGGAINLISKRPSGEFGFKQTVDVGNYGYLRANTQIDLPSMGDLVGKISLLHQQKDGWVKNDGQGRDFGEKDTQGLRLALEWSPAEDVSVAYAFDYGQSKYGSAYYQIGGPTQGAFAALPVASGRVKRTTTSVPYRASDYEISGHSLTATWQINDMIALKSITAYRSLEQSNYTDSGAIAGSTRIFSNDPFNVDQDQFSQEFQLQGFVLDGALDYTLGAYYFKEDGKEFNSDFISVAPGVEIKIYDRDLEAENSAQALFAHINWMPGILDERLRLSAGLRYSKDKRSIDMTQTTFAVKESDNWSKVSPSFTAAYDLSESANVYLKYTEGYRTGGYNGRASTEREARIPVDEETLTSYELGFKTEWFDQRLRFNMAAFLSDYEDIQLSLLDRDGPPGSVLRINAGEAEMKGVEVDLSAALSEQLSLRVSYAHLSSDFVEVIDPLSGQDISDDFLLVASPENSASIDLAYQIMETEWGRLSADINYVWKDKREIATTVQDAVDPLDSFGVLNARLTLGEIELSGQGTASIALWSKNVLDEEYELDGFGLPTIGSTVVTYGEPRSYGIRFEYVY